MDQLLTQRIHDRIKREAERLIKKQHDAEDAAHAARVNVAFATYEGVYWKLHKEEDHNPFDYNQEMDEAAKKLLRRRINSRGLWSIKTFWRLYGTWQQACGEVSGFVGDDWKDSGYDITLKLAAMQEFLKVAIQTPIARLPEERAADFCNAIQIARFVTRA